MTDWIYTGTGRAATLVATRDLARHGGVWTPGPHLPDPDPGVQPGDVLLLLWREDAAHEDAIVVGAGRIAAPVKPWGGRAWIDAVPPDDPLFRASAALGYGGPRNYRALARLEDWTEDTTELRRRMPGLLGGAVVGGTVRGVPSGALLAQARPGVLTAAPGDEPTLDERLLGRIQIRPDTFGGKPVVRGLRIAVEQVLAWLAHGADQAELLREFPALEAEDIRACLLYAARRLGNERVEVGT
jgi:uncharacterized protein (DUF433 family)